MTDSNQQSSKNQIDHACSEMLKDALPILQGLLASGHFTYPPEHGDEPGCWTEDNGPDWNKSDKEGIQYFAYRGSTNAVTCALSLADELRKQIQINVKLRQGIDARNPVL